MLVTIVFSCSVWFMPQTRYNPDFMPPALFNVPVLIAIMMVGPLFYVAGTRIKKKHKAITSARALHSKQL